MVAIVCLMTLVTYLVPVPFTKQAAVRLRGCSCLHLYHDVSSSVRLSALIWVFRYRLIGFPDIALRMQRHYDL